MVSGARSKLRDAGTSDFTAVAHNRLQFMIAEATPDEIRLRAIGVDGAVIDEFEPGEGTMTDSKRRVATLAGLGGICFLIVGLLPVAFLDWARRAGGLGS